MNAHATIAAEIPVLGPTHTGFIAEVDAIDAWMAAARPGDCCVYARAKMLSAKAGGVMRARGLYDRGLVTLEPRRRWLDNPDMFEFRLRLRKAVPCTPSPPPAIRLSPDESRVLAYLEGRAEAGQPVEMNPEIARRLGMRSGTVVNRCLTRLINLGLIRRQPMTCKPFRVITIAASGARTAGGAA